MCLPKDMEDCVYSLIEFDCPGDGTCSDQGKCDHTTGICECFLGYKGNTCQGNCVYYLLFALIT